MNRVFSLAKLVCGILQVWHFSTNKCGARSAECGIAVSLRDVFFDVCVSHTIKIAAPRALRNSAFRTPHSALGWFRTPHSALEWVAP